MKLYESEFIHLMSILKDTVPIRDRMGGLTSEQRLRLYNEIIQNQDILVGEENDQFYKVVEHLPYRTVRYGIFKTLREAVQKAKTVYPEDPLYVDRGSVTFGTEENPWATVNIEKINKGDEQ